MNNIVNQFQSRLGEPTSFEALNQYLTFVTSQLVTEGVVGNYKEKHHILPRSVFPELAKEQWNIVELCYSDHVNAHVLLVTAYPIGNFIRPLNFMLNGDQKKEIGYNQLLSEKVRSWWVQFKKDPRFKEWRDKRAECARQQLVSGHSKIMSDIRYNDPTATTKLSEQSRRRWMQDEFRERMRQIMLDYHNTPGVREMASERSKQMWANRSLEEAERIKDALRQQQKNNNSRVAEINKEKWQDPEFRTMMKTRRRRGPDTGKMKEKWQDPVWKQHMLEARRKAREANKH